MAKGIVSAVIVLTVVAATGSMRCVAQSEQDVIRVTGPVRQIPSVQAIPVPPADGSTEPYKSGLLNPKDAKQLVEALVGVDRAKTTTIIHLLRWKDAEHTAVLFQKWYLYDPDPSKTSFYLQSEQQVFERTAIPGRKDLQFVYIHLNANLNNPPNEGEWRPYSPIDSNNPQPVTWPSSSTISISSINVAASRTLATIVTVGQNGFAKDQETCLSWPAVAGTQAAGAVCGRVSTIINPTTLQLSTSNAFPDSDVLNCTDSCKAIPRIPTLKNPISYTITVTKEKTQFIQDIQTLLQIVGATAAGLERQSQPPGYYSVSTFQSRWSTSSIAIAASLNGNAKSPSPPAGSTTQGATANQLASITYHNEKPAWIGLSAGIPITTYKDVVFQTSSGTLVPQSITQQKAYAFLDGYIPPVLPSLVSFRYIPHPFVGFPLKGEVFRHVMFGGGVGAHWLEPFGGVILDTENNKTMAGSTTKTKLTLQPVFGLKISISALAKALKK